jgi:hypothetical protein
MGGHPAPPINTIKLAESELAMAEEPLLVKLIRCPACEQLVPLHQANPRLYTVLGRESDRHVTGYRWLHGVTTGVQPHHYRIWQCPKCLFADLAERVDPADPDLDAARQAFRDISIEKHMVLDSLRELVAPSPELEPQGAIAIHLAGLLVTSLTAPGRTVDHSRLGLIALRLAWLYRELEGPAPRADPGPEPPQPPDPMAEATERLVQILAEAGTAVQDLRRIAGPGPDAAGGGPCRPRVELVEVRLEALQTEVAALQMAIAQGGVPATAAAEPDPASGLGRALQALAPLWPDLPRDERGSLRLALAAFEYSYQFEDLAEHDVAQVNLILDLLIRLGELERALDWTQQMSKQAGETVTDLQRRMAEARASQTLSGNDATAIQRKIAALNLSQRQAGERRREILERLLARDRDQIQELLAQTPQLPLQERLQALRAAGIQDGVLALLTPELGEPAREGSGWIRGLFRPR